MIKLIIQLIYNLECLNYTIIKINEKYYVKMDTVELDVPNDDIPNAWRNIVNTCYFKSRLFGLQFIFGKRINSDTEIVVYLETSDNSIILQDNLKTVDELNEYINLLSEFSDEVVQNMCNKVLLKNTNNDLTKKMPVEIVDMILNNI